MSKPILPVQVECYAGYRGDEEPRVFLVDGRRVVIVRLESRWLTPSHRYFEVEGDDGVGYTLRHHVLSDAWELEKTGSS